MRNYKCFNKSVFYFSDYSLLPIREQDKYLIKEWRNEQIDILRQKELLTNEQQENYFRDVVRNLFNKDKPNQILWSFFLFNELIGYGGLVHIDWDAKNAEISFVLCNERNINHELFKKDWFNYLNIISDVAKNYLFFNKIYTYAYDIRDYYFEVMYNLDFTLEARLKRHVLIKNKLHDVLILSKSFEQDENTNIN